MLKLYCRTKPNYKFRFRAEFTTYKELNEYILVHHRIEYYVEGFEEE